MCEGIVILHELITTQSLLFTTMRKKPLENIVGKRENAVMTEINPFSLARRY